MKSMHNTDIQRAIESNSQKGREMKRKYLEKYKYIYYISK